MYKGKENAKADEDEVVPRHLERDPPIKPTHLEM